MKRVRKRLSDQDFFAPRLTRAPNAGRVEPQQSTTISPQTKTVSIDEAQAIEKLRYMHRNPVKRGLVSRPGDWRRISLRSYMFGEKGRVRINDPGHARFKYPDDHLDASRPAASPTLRLVQDCPVPAAIPAAPPQLCDSDEPRRVSGLRSRRATLYA
jgi:hypothetical protein